MKLEFSKKETRLTCTAQYIEQVRICFNQTLIRKTEQLPSLDLRESNNRQWYLQLNWLQSEHWSVKMNVRSGMTGIGQAVNSVNSPWDKLMLKFKENQQRYKDVKDKDAK